MHYALGCNGSGVAMMTYLGPRRRGRSSAAANRVCAFDAPAFPEQARYNGNPWFLPAIGGWYRLRDRIDRLLAG